MTQSIIPIPQGLVGKRGKCLENNCNAGSIRQIDNQIVAASCE